MHKASRNRIIGVAVALAVALAVVLVLLVIAPRWRMQRMRSQANAYFDKTRLFVLLEKEHPEIRAKYVDMVLRRAAGDQAVSAFAWGQNELSRHLPSYAARTSDASLLSFGSLIVELLDILHAKSDAACVTFLFGGAGSSSFKMDSYFTRETQERLVAVQEQLVERAVESPAEPVTETEGAELMGQLAQRLRAKHGEQFMDKLSQLGNPSAGMSHGDVCVTTLGMYREALALPPPSNAKLLRALFAETPDAQ